MRFVKKIQGITEVSCDIALFNEIKVLTNMSEWYRIMNGYKNDNSSETSAETSCDVSNSSNFFSGNLSPIPASIQPRKLDFTTMDDDDSNRAASGAPDPLSPPYKRVKALRLFDEPHTPKALRDKCSTPSHHLSRSRLFPPKPTAQAGPSFQIHPPSDEDSALGSLPPDDHDDSRVTRPVANINPFTPVGQAMNKKKRSLSKTSSREETPEQPAKRLRESNISRYNVEFVELDVIGRGQFGRVARCVNKLDGCVYAVKRSLRPVAGSSAERAALTEVYAHAALGKHAHVVRYYSAWAEDDHMIIQNEYCDGGSLQQKLQNGPLPEPELLLLLAHIAKGLSYIHSHHLVHMDVKPGNIFICSNDVEGTESDDGYDEDYHQANSHHIYKIGDLGHVTCVSAPSVEEGDCRYLPTEVLQENFIDLTKADIFAFGLTLFEAGGGGPLPKNGQKWHDIRAGKLPYLPNLSRELNRLLKKMVDPVAILRPSASSLRRNPLLQSRAGHKSNAQLRRELAEANLSNQLLTRKLCEAARCIKSLTPNVLLASKESAKFKTRAAKKLQNSRESQLPDVMQSDTTTPLRINRRTVMRTKHQSFPL